MKPWVDWRGYCITFYQINLVMKIVFIILTTFFLFIGCGQEKNEEISIIGQRSLIKYEPGFSPTENYSLGTILWTFNANNSVYVMIADVTEVNDGIPLNKSGTYSYSNTENELLLDHNQRFKYEMTSGELIISTFIGPSADGIRITFSKVVE